jgi:hypothetical protein
VFYSVSTTSGAPSEQKIVHRYSMDSSHLTIVEWRHPTHPPSRAKTDLCPIARFEPALFHFAWLGLLRVWRYGCTSVEYARTVSASLVTLDALLVRPQNPVSDGSGFFLGLRCYGSIAGS